MDIEKWSVSIIVFIIGLIFWLITYIGAPYESKKTGKYVSGVPGFAFISFLLAGLLSPCKWLSLLCFTDFSITILPFYLLKEHISNKRVKKQRK